VLITLITFLPLVPTALGLAFDLIGLHDFGRTFGRPIGWRAYLFVIVSLPAYLMLLSSAAVWASVRHLRGHTNWHKTQHVNAHRGLRVGAPEGGAA
jgi:hypothetical protein